MIRTIVTSGTLVDDTVTLELLSRAGLYPGYTAHVEGAGSPWDGQHELLTVTTTTDTAGVDHHFVTYSKNHANTTLTELRAQLTIPITWIAAEDLVEELVYQPVDAAELAALDAAAESAMSILWDKRAASGYVDLPHVVPNPAVRLGTVKLGAALYRQRGSVDQFSSFEQQDTGMTLGGAWPEILRLCGLSKPQIDGVR